MCQIVLMSGVLVVIVSVHVAVVSLVVFVVFVDLSPEEGLVHLSEVVFGHGQLLDHDPDLLPLLDQGEAQLQHAGLLTLGFHHLRRGTNVVLSHLDQYEYTRI